MLLTYAERYWRFEKDQKCILHQFVTQTLEVHSSLKLSDSRRCIKFPHAGLSLITVCSTFLTDPFVLLILFASWREGLRGAYRWLSFHKKKKPFSLMRVYCGKLYANLKMFAGLHLGHTSSLSQSHCVWQLEAALGKENHWFEYQNPLMEKKSVHGKWCERVLPFRHAPPVGEAFHLRQLQLSKAVSKTRLQLYCC